MEICCQYSYARVYDMTGLKVNGHGMIVTYIVLYVHNFLGHNRSCVAVTKQYMYLKMKVSCFEEVQEEAKQQPSRHQNGCP